MRFWRLRWAFIYYRTQPVYGMWDLRSPDPMESAAMQPRIGLERVEIQAQRLDTQETVVVDSCPASNFHEFRWIGQVGIRLKDVSQSAQTMTPMNIGLELHRTDGKRTIAMIDGKVRKDP